MADLPEQEYDKFFGNFNFEFWKRKHNEDSEQGLLLKTNGNISVDNLQGKVQIFNQSNSAKISLGNVENGILHVFAPGCDVYMTLKSLHESSYIHCKNLYIQIPDDFFGANVLRFKDDEVIPELDSIEEILEMGPKPNLFVEAENEINIEVLSNFEILKR